MKKTLFFSLALLLAGAIGGLVMAQTTAIQIDGVYYLLDKAQKTATVTFAPNDKGFVEEGTYGGTINIPTQVMVYDEATYNYEDYTVTAIADSAFAKCEYLNYIIVPNTVETLGVNLLAGSYNVKQLKISDGDKPIYFTYNQGVTGEEISFGEMAFSGTYLYLGRDVETKTSVPYPSSVFHTWSGIEELVIGEKVTKLPDALCRFTRELKSIQINTPTPLAAGAGMLMFLSEPDIDAKAITLYVPEGQKQAYAAMDVWSQLSIEEMDDMRRYGIEYVQDYFDFKAGELFYKMLKDEDGQNIISPNGKKAIEVVMPQVWYLNPDGTYLSRWSSEFPYKQYEITIPQYVNYNDEDYEVTKIGDYCFRNATNLEELNMPMSVTAVGSEIISGCMALKTLMLHNTLTEASWLAFAYSGLEEVTIPTSINHWEMGAFQSSEYLRKVTFRESEDGPDTIPERMFWGCTALRSVTLPNSIRFIGNGCFSACDALSHIDLPASLEVLTERMFHGCPLRELYIPAGVQEVEPHFLLGASQLTRLTVDADNRYFDSRMNSNAIIRTRDNTLVAGCGSTVIPATVDSIAEGAFDGLGSIHSMTLPASIKKIGANGLWELTNLKILKSEIENPAGVIGEYSIGGWDADLYNSLTIYVPAGKAAAYKADAEWGKFHNIVEAEPVAVTMLQPATQGDTDITFQSVNDETDLTNAVIDNLYVTCDTTAGDTYDNAEHAFVFQTTVDELQMSAIMESENIADAVRNNFAGIVLQVPAGEGTIKVTAKTTDNRAVVVTIENMASTVDGETVPYTTIYTNQPVKGEVVVDYETSKAAYIYIYGAETIKGSAIELAPKKLAKRPALQQQKDEETEDSESVMIYGVRQEVKAVINGVEDLNNTTVGNVQKLIRDGQVLIIRDGKTYNILGTEM